MATITSFIQLDSSGVELGGLAININGSAPYPAQHKLFIPFIRASELEMRAVLQSGNSASLVNNISNWTSCDALTWPLLRATASRNDTSTGTTSETHVVNIQIRRKNWPQDAVSGNITLVNSAIVTVSPLASQPWVNFTASEFMADTGTTYSGVVKLTFLSSGTLQVLKKVTHGGSTDLEETDTFSWNAGIPTNDLEILITNINADGPFINGISNWTTPTGPLPATAELKLITQWSEPNVTVAEFDVHIRQISNPSNLGITSVRLTVALTY